MAEGFGDGISAISGETLEKAMRELGEVPEKRPEAIQELREKIEHISEEEGLTFERKDDKFLLRFLRARKFNSDRALQLYVNYYRYRHKYAPLFTTRTPKGMERILTSGLFRVMDVQNGPKLLFLFPACWDYENVPFERNFKVLMLLLDKLIEDEETQVHGFTLVNNMKGASLYTVMNFARTEQIRKGVFIELIQEAFPARFKGLHLVNQPWYVSIILTIVRPFMKQKLKDRLYMHGADFESLHEHLAPEHLPIEFGGHQPQLELNSTLKLFENELTE